MDNSARNVDNPAAIVDKAAQQEGLWRPPKLELAAPASTYPPVRTSLEHKQERTERRPGRYSSLADLPGLERLSEIDCRGFKHIVYSGAPLHLLLDPGLCWRVGARPGYLPRKIFPGFACEFDCMAYHKDSCNTDSDAYRDDNAQPDQHKEVGREQV